MKLGSIEIGRRALIVAAVAVGVLLLGAVTAYAVDAAKRDRIAPGVRVAGVDLGGLTEEQAHHRLNADVARPLLRPVKVVFAGRNFYATPQQLKVRPSVDAMVDEAFETSDQGWIGPRIWRYVTGGEVNRDLPPRVDYSERQLDVFIVGLQKRIDRPPQNASVDPSPSSIDPQPSLDGLKLRTDALRSGLEDALQTASIGRRVVRVRADRTEPDVTTKELAGDYPFYITINRGAFQLRFYRSLKLVKTYPIAVGMVGLETPQGLYHIQDKGINVAWRVPNSDWAGKLAGKTIPGGAPDNPIKARWMGIYNGAGIHGTSDIGSLGSAASHGCVRMAIPDVIELYDQVPVGTPVYVG